MPTLDPGFVDDAQALPLMEDLLEAVVAENDKRHLPAIAFKMLQPGQNPILDHAGNDRDGCSEVIVWMTNAFPVSDSGFPEPATKANCATEMAFELNVGVYRCLEIEDKDGIPTPDEQIAQTRIVLADMASMKNAIRCWLQGKRQYNLGAYAQFGPGGNAVGGGWTVTVGGLI